MGKQGTAIISFHDPFAGFGQRGRFASWLLSNLGDRAEELRNAVTRRFSERQIPDTRINYHKLTGKGLLAESREYYMARRKGISVGLHISRFGRDLYISVVTYYKGNISLGRVLVALLMVALLVIVPAAIFFGSLEFTTYSSMQDSTQSYAILEWINKTIQSIQDILPAIVTVACCVMPLVLLDAIMLNLGFLYSVYKTFTDKDPWILLRTPPNEFQEDDIVSLERAVEDTVREALDTIGINSQLLSSAPKGEWRKRLI